MTTKYLLEITDNQTTDNQTTDNQFVDNLLSEYFPYMDMGCLKERLVTNVLDVLEKRYLPDSERQVLFRWLISKQLRLIHYYYYNQSKGVRELLSRWRSILLKSKYFTKNQNRYVSVDEFLSEFYLECVRKFNQKVGVENINNKRLRNAEIFAFSDLYAMMNISIKGVRYILIKLRYRSYCYKKVNFVESIIDFTGINETLEQYDVKNLPMYESINKSNACNNNKLIKTIDSQIILGKLRGYLLQSADSDRVIRYFDLYSLEMTTPEIAVVMRLNSSEIDNLQQQFKYHVLKFLLESEWQLVHEWLGISIDNQLGLTSKNWNRLLNQLTPIESDILQSMLNKKTDIETANDVGISESKIKINRRRLLKKAYDLRKKLG
jgi:DNA-binding CsgD family transcriptional regulator